MSLLHLTTKKEVLAVVCENTVVWIKEKFKVEGTFVMDLF